MVVTVNELAAMLDWAKKNSTPHISKNGRNIACVTFEMQESGEAGRGEDGKLGIKPVDSAKFSQTILPVA